MNNWQKIMSMLVIAMVTISIVACVGVFRLIDIQRPRCDHKSAKSFSYRSYHYDFDFLTHDHRIVVFKCNGCGLKRKILGRLPAEYAGIYDRAN